MQTIVCRGGVAGSEQEVGGELRQPAGGGAGRRPVPGGGGGRGHLLDLQGEGRGPAGGGGGGEAAGGKEEEAGETGC